MFTHVMIGSNDLESAGTFYDATFAALGGKRGEMDARGRLIYLHEGGRLMITNRSTVSHRQLPTVGRSVSRR